MGWVVYKHTFPNEKVYIGITGKSPFRRWRKDGSGYEKHCHLYRAILKYGWDNIKHEILYENLTENEASEIERKLIMEYQSDNPEHGYNKRSGGEHYHFTEESRKKMSAAKVGRKLSDETKQRIRDIKKGHAVSAETRNKIGKANSKGVLCVETGMVFDSISDAEGECKVYNIGNCCNGKRKSAGGYHWKFIS